MADLGNLWFSLGLDDSKFEKQWKDALAKYGKDSKMKIDVEISQKTIESLRKLKEMGGTSKEWAAVRNAAKAAKEVAAMAVQQEKYNTQLARTKKLQDSVSSSQGNITKNYRTQSLWLTNLSTLASNYLSLFAVKGFVSNLARISGEFELQRRTLQAMVGEFEGSQLYSQIKELSVVSPFQFKDLSGYAKQLAAFSVPYNELYNTTKSLADISAGLGVDMSRIILAYGQIRSAGVLRGTELRQLTEAGVPILEKLAEKFTQLEGQAVSVGDVFGKISQKLVPFEMVKDIFAEMTSEGGKFYNMQELQAETLAGKISNLTDAYQIMLSELGESNDGFLKGGVETLYKLIDNYEVLAGVIKTVIGATAAYQLAQTAAFAIEKIDKIRKSAVAMNLLKLNIRAAAVEMKALDIATKGTVWGVILSIVTSLGIAMYELAKSTTRFREEMDEMLNADLSKLKDEQQTLEKLKKTTDEAAQGSIDRNNAINRINSHYGEYLTNMLSEASTAEDIASAYNRITEAMQNKYKQEAIQKAKSKVDEEYGDAINDRVSSIKKELVSRGLTDLEAKDVTTLLSDYFKSGGAKFEQIKKIYNDRLGADLVKSANLEEPDWLSHSIYRLRQEILAYEKAKKEVEDIVSIRFGSNTYDTKAEADLVDRVTLAYDKRVADIRKNMPIEKANAELQRAEIARLQELIEGYGQLGLVSKASEYESQLEALKKNTSDWAKKVGEVITDDKSLFEFNPKDNEQLSAYLERLQERYDDLLSTQRLLTSKINNNEDIIGSKKELSIVEDKLKGIKAVAKSINFKLVDKQGTKDANKALNLDRLLQSYKDKLSDFTSDVMVKTEELKANLSSISLENIGADEVTTKLAEINSEFEKSTVDLTKYKEKLISAWRDVLEAKAKSQGTVFKGEVTLGMLPEEAQEAIRIFEALIAKKKEYDLSLLNKDVVNRYASLEKQKNDILEKYMAEFDQVYDPITDSFADGFDLDLFHKRLREELESVSRDLDPIYKQIFGNLQTMTREQILKAIQLAKNLLKSGGLSDELSIELRDRIKELQKAYDEIDVTIKPTLDFNTFIDQIDSYKQLKKIAEETGAEEDARNAALGKEQMVMSGIVIAAYQLSQGLSHAAGHMKELAELSGDVELGDAADKMSALAQNLGAAAQGAASGGWIGAIVGGVMDMITQTASGIANTKKEIFALEQSLKDYQHELLLLKSTLNEDDYNTIFGVNALSKVNDAANKAKESLQDYYNSVAKKVSDPGAPKYQANLGLGIFTADIQNAFLFGKKQSNLWLQQVDAYKRGLTELQGMAINLTKYTGWQKFWGRQDKYQSLIDYRSDLFNEDGTLDIDKAKAFLEVDQKITDTQKKQIEQAIELQEVYEENMEIISDYLSEIFSNTANTIATQMIDAFAQTGDAAFALGDVVNEVARNMASDLVESLLLDQYLAPAMNRIKNLYDATSGDYEENSLLRTQKAIQAIQEGIAAAQNAVPEVNKLLEALEATGIDLASDSQSASQVLSGLTEDQQNLLVSYINGIRADVSINKGVITAISNHTGSINNNIAAALIVWKQIEANTHRSADGVETIIGFFESVVGASDGGGGQAIRVNIA